MAKRKHRQYQIFNTEEVQGDGSFVKIKNLSISELIALTNTQDGKTLSKEESAQIALDVLNVMIVDWNWVDDDDNPLPIPAQTPGVIKDLPFQETNFLLEKTGVTGLFDTKN